MGHFCHRPTVCCFHSDHFTKFSFISLYLLWSSMYCSFFQSIWGNMVTSSWASQLTKEATVLQSWACWFNCKWNMRLISVKFQIFQQENLQHSKCKKKVHVTYALQNLLASQTPSNDYRQCVARYRTGRKEGREKESADSFVNIKPRLLGIKEDA